MTFPIAILGNKLAACNIANYGLMRSCTGKMDRVAALVHAHSIATKNVIDSGKSQAAEA